MSSYQQRWARTTFSGVPITILQLEGSSSAIAIPQHFKEMLLRKCNSAVPQSQFFLKSATSKSATCELHFRNFWHIFGRGIWSIHEQKIGGKNLMLLFLQGKFLVSR
jgi:hypothetical protein